MIPPNITAPSQFKNIRVLAALNGQNLFGSERASIEVFKALRDLGAVVEVGVNAKDEGGAVGQCVREAGFASFPLAFGNQWSLQWLRRYPWSVFEKASEVWRSSQTFTARMHGFRPTHIYLGSTLAYSFLALSLARCRVPLIFCSQDCPPVDSAFNLRIWRMARNRATHIVGCSDFVKQSILEQQTPPAKVSTIYNIAPLRFQNSSKPKAAKQPGKLLYAGQIAEKKGVLDLVESFALVRKTKPDITLDIIGGSVYDEEFRGQVKHRIAELGMGDVIILHGQVSNPEDYFQSASLHIAPSRWEEPLGNVVLEAKREATPSVIYPSGGLPEMVRHQVDGYICAEKTVNALTAGLLWMLDGADRLPQMGLAAQADYQARFSRERLTQQWAEVITRTNSPTK